ncbi:hypothetical protein Ahy_A09g044423 [Arachis hypogaea]|uniref:Uncharacterized protein n=1 Tax=Arachis hypogaea TaxID=3818 RepID=A0A445BK27_ARAHY|nr:hypothetical protein Ahy_A09g044423 [Arachis hypogaea]
MLFAETTTEKESRENSTRKKQKQTTTATKIDETKMKKTIVTKKDKPRYNLKKFGVLAHVPKMNVSHAFLRELVDCYNEYHGYLKTLHGKTYVTPGKIADVLGIHHGGNRFPDKVEYGKLNEADKQIFDSLKCVTLATLTKSVLDMSVEGEENRQRFRRTFGVYISKCFLLPATVSMASPIHKPPIFCVDNI